jgi:hypothetical protein
MVAGHGRLVHQTAPLLAGDNLRIQPLEVPAIHDLRVEGLAHGLVLRPARQILQLVGINVQVK